MANGLSGFIKAGIDVLTTSVNRVTGKILAQVGSVTEKSVGDGDGVGVAEHDNVEWWQHVGFASRPPKPDAGKKAAQALVMSMGDHDIAFASQDVRALDQYGNLDFGETCLYAPGVDGLAQGRIIGKKDGSVAIFTTEDNTKAGRSVYFRVATDGFMWVAPWGTIRFDAKGFHVLHSSGANFSLGGVGGIPGLESIIGSYIKMQASTVSASSVGAPLADATSTIAAIAALQTQLTAIAAGFAKLALVVGPVQGTDAVAASAIVAPVVIVSGVTVGVQSLLIPKGSGMT